MTAAEDPGDIRVGVAEREAAIAALNQHWQAGRLDPTEHEARTTKAYAAVTRADLDALFVDLPGSWRPPAFASGETTAASAPGEPTATSAPAARTRSGATSSGPLVPEQSFLGRRRDLVMALMPFLCLLLFFTVARTWLVWLLIPITAIVLYGADGKKDRRDRR